MNNDKKRLDHREEDAKHLFELLHNNSDWVWEVDAQGRYMWSSDVVTELLGVPPDQVIGKTPFDFMPPGEAERVAGAFGAIVAEKRAFSGLVNRNQRADGSIVVLETSGIPLFDEQGELRGYRGIDRNISNLGERVLQLETIYETTPVALCMIDRHGRLVMSNKAMAKLLGEALETEDHFQRLMPDYWPFFLTDFALADKGEALPSASWAGAIAVTIFRRYRYMTPWTWGWGCRSRGSISPNVARQSTSSPARIKCYNSTRNTII